MGFIEQGFEMVPNFTSSDWCSEILGEIEAHELALDATGIRHINKKLPSVANYIASAEFSEIKEAVGFRVSLK